MRKYTLAILVLIIFFAFSGCAASDKAGTPALQGNAPTTQNNASPPNNNPAEANPPHSFGDFKGANQSFSGGGPVQNYNLAGIRRVPHPSFYRMVFEFTLEENGVERAQAVPAYQITMNDDQTQIIMDLPGVSWASAIKEKDAIISSAPLLKDIQFQTKAQGGGQILLSLQQKAAFQVFDLANPSRVVIVMNPIN